jgi:competence protein ComEC
VPADEASETIAAMTLGLRNSMSGEMSDVFMRTGTMHIIAISGLHVALIAYFFTRLLRITGLPRAWTGIIILGVVWFYTFATGIQSTAVRSAVMATVFISTWVLKRPPDLLNTVFASAGLILLVQPEQLFQASFQLSFSVVFVIAVIVNIKERYYPDANLMFRNKVLRIDPLLPEELVPQWKKFLFRVVGMIQGNFVIGAASFLAALPLAAYYFNTVSPISLLANMVAVPLSSVSLAMSVLSVIASPIAPLSNLFSWVAMKATIWFIEICGSFRFGYFYVPKPNPLVISAYVTFLALFFMALIPRFRMVTRQIIGAAGVILLALACVGSANLNKPIAQLTVLPCAGTPMLVEEGRKKLLIDSSSERDADYMVKRFLRARGHGSVDGLVITHGDAQVVGGFEMMWNEFAAKKVYTSGVKMRSPGYRRAIALLKEHPKRWEAVAVGSDVQGWKVLHPERGERGFARADDNAVVLKKRIGAWTFLHLSELGEAGQKKLAESAVDLRADIVITGMPEQGEPLGEELLELIRPRLIVLGTAEYPYTAQGKPELRERLEKSGADLFYLNEEDAVTITVEAGACVLTTIAGRRVALK